VSDPFIPSGDGGPLDYERDCVLYLRKSKGRAGIPRQRRDGKALAARLRWRIVAEFVDVDKTAHAKVGEPPPPRPDYNRMLAMLRADDRPVPLGVIGWHADRLHRSTDVEDFIVVCHQHKHPVETVRSGGYELWTATGRKRIRQDAVDAAYEVDHLIERIDSDRDEKVRQGRWMGGPVPFGWKLQRLDLDDDDKVLMLDADAAKAIQWGCRQVLLGASLASIAKEWTARGFTRRQGGVIDGAEVRRILLRARNAGLMESHGEVVETELPGGVAEWPAIVSETTWRAVKLLLDGPDRLKGNSTIPKWLGTSLFRCGVCDGDVGPKDVGDGTVKTSMSSGWHNGEDTARVAYRCKTGQRGHVSRDAERVDDFVTDVVLARLAKPDFIDLLTATPPPDLEAMRAELAVLKGELAEWRRLAEAGEVTAVAFAPVEKRLLRQIEEKNAEMTAAVQSPVIRELIGIPDIAEAWGARDLVWKRAVLRNLVVVTINKPTHKGRPAGWREGEEYFDYESIDLEWLPLGAAAR
jgi:DNA invertase Pin-like site-specific DNA recombinase